MEKSCKRCGEYFEISEDDQKFLKRVSPNFNRKKFPIPSSCLCGHCRLQQFMSFRNERCLYPRTCENCGKNIISMYSPDKGSKVFCSPCWWGDAWSPMDFGIDFDQNKSSFNQYRELQKSVPRESVVVLNCQNCEYNNHIRFSKDCYMCSLISQCESMYYCYWCVANCFKMVDCCYGFTSSFCYECQNILDCYECVYLVDSMNTKNSLFSYNLIGCNRCIFCSNLRNKDLFIFNKKVSEEEFEKFKSKMMGSSASFSKYKSEFLEFFKNVIRRCNNNYQVENCTGDNLKRCKNCENCFDGEDCEDVKNITSVGQCKDCREGYSVGFRGLSELVYYGSVIRGGTRVLFCYNTSDCSDIIYCDSCFSCKNLFWCVGLRNKQYCILNKQYSKEDYEKIVSGIIERMMKDGEWGEFFPVDLAIFGYNETIAFDDFPVLKNEAQQKGFLWSDYVQESPKASKTIKASELPETSETKEELFDCAIECEITKRPYKITRQELEFYKKLNLPLPRKHPEQRFKERMQLKNPRKLWERNCSNEGCKEVFQASYSGNDRKIYCEKCYLKIVD